MDMDSTSNGSIENCFFADVTLDLEDARCIEETPEVHTTSSTTATATGGSGNEDCHLRGKRGGPKQLLPQFNQSQEGGGGSSAVLFK